MKYLLIDTNIWAKEVLSSDSDHENLETLEFWVNNGDIQLLVPSIIKYEEWPKVRDLYLDNYEKFSQSLLQPVNSTLSPLSTLMDLHLGSIKSKAQRIDTLINNGIYYVESTDVKADIYDRVRKHKAPFHVSGKNMGDASIILSTIEHIKKIGEDSFWFITSNPKDFCDPFNKLNLHPELPIEGLDVKFFHQLGWAISKLKKELPGVTKIDAFETDRDYITQFFLIDKPQDLSLIDQLYRSMDRYYDQLPFIPHHILARIFPFKIAKAKYSYTYSSAFAINSNHTELIELFASIQIKEGNDLIFTDELLVHDTKDAQRKVLEIYRKLNDNLIYDLHSLETHAEVDIRLEETRVCNCARCTYNRMEFSLSLNQLLETASSTPQETLKQAFVHYHFGNFSKALKLLYGLYQHCRSHNKPLLGFICLYNLKRLQHYIKGHFLRTDEEVAVIMQELELITLNRYILTFSFESAFIKENMRWIDENAFYYFAYNKIVETVEKIRDHYYLQLKGGWSSNSHIRVLLGAFAEIETYLNNNCIIYSNYSEFSNLFDRVLEGFFISHAMSEQQSSRLQSFDDYLLLKIIKYGQPNNVLKYFNQYHLSFLRVNNTDPTDNILENTIINFFKDYEILCELSNDKIEENGYFFWAQYRRMLLNTFVILGIAEFRPESIISIVEQLLPLLKRERFVRKTEHRYLALFIYRKGQYFTTEQMRNLLNISIQHEWMHENEIFSALRTQITRYHKELLIHEGDTYEIILRHFFFKCPKCNTFHNGGVLINLYDLLTTDLKKDLEARVVHQLKTEFNSDTYYLFSIYGIIDYSIFFDRYVDHFQVPVETASIRRLYDNREAHLTCLNELLNLCFKYEVDLNKPIFQKFKGITDYYDWLLDMNNFNYSKFNPEWLLEYGTDYYLKRMFGISDIKEAVKNYLKKTKHPQISEYYIKFT